MEKSIQIASKKRSLFSATFGCGENSPERAAKKPALRKTCVCLPVPLYCDVAAERNNGARNRHYQDFITANVIMITALIRRRGAALIGGGA